MAPTLDEIRTTLLEGVPLDALDQELPKRPTRAKRWFLSRSRSDRVEPRTGSETSRASSESLVQFGQTAVVVVGEARARLSASTKLLHEVLDPLLKTFEQPDSFEVDVPQVLAPIETLRQRMKSIGQQVDAVKAFEKALAEGVVDCPSLRELHDGLCSMREALHDHLAGTARMLELPTKLRARAAEVTHDLEQLNELRRRLGGLAGSFRIEPVVRDTRSVLPLMPITPSSAFAPTLTVPASEPEASLNVPGVLR